LPAFIIEGNAKFQLEVSGNKDVICFPSKVTDHLGARGPQVKNPCLIGISSGPDQGRIERLPVFKISHFSKEL
jgi:hypothetical protein